MAVKELEKGKRYQVDFRDQDRRRVRELVFGTKTDAQNLLNDRRQQVWRAKQGLPGGYVTARQEEASRGGAFSEFTQRFLRDYGDLRRSSYYRDTLAETRHIMRFFGEKDVREITEADFDEFRRLISDELSASTVRKYLTVLHTMFRQAKRWGVIEVNLASDLDKPPEPDHRTRYLSVEEWSQLQAAAEPWLRPILAVALATGARLKEVVGLRWEDVDRQAGMIQFSSDNKTGKSRAIPLSTTVRSVLRDRVRHLSTPYVFVDGEGEPYISDRQRNRISQRVRAAMRRAGITGASFHSLRHTVGSWLAQDGFSEPQIGALLGHAAASVTGRYVHLHVEALRPLAQALDERLSRGHNMDTSEVHST